MPGNALSAGEWLALLTHLKKWVSNLRRAKAARRDASRKALRAVIIAVRETTVYPRSLRQGLPGSLGREERLAVRWTNLAFELEDLGLTQLAGRCSIKGRYWADPEAFDRSFLERAGVRLADVERLAQANLRVLDRGS